MKEASKNSLFELIETVKRLRAPDGCPWDRKQTHQSLRPYLIEEAYEVLDVIDQIETEDDLKNEKIKSEFKEELGDLLLQIVLHSEMTREKEAFDIFDVAQNLNDKMIRRHPHVFADQSAETADEVYQNWEQQKAKEKASDPDKSILDGLPKNLPALQKTNRMIEKVTKVGFTWKDLNGPLEKVEEELGELKEEIKAKNQEKIEEELGDLLFSICNLAHSLKVEPEASLRRVYDKFQNRFRHVERQVKASGKALSEASLEEMDQYWNESKKL